MLHAMSVLLEYLAILFGTLYEFFKETKEGPLLTHHCCICEYVNISN